MKDDFPDYIPDMDHDGKITGMDSALFHDMLDEDQKKEEQYSRTSSSFSGSSNTEIAAYRIVKTLFLLLFGGYLVLLFKGVFPINGLTSVLALISAVCVLRTLLL